VALRANTPVRGTAAPSGPSVGGVTALDRPFRGSAAVAAGLVTKAQLRGPRFVRLFPDVHVAAGVPIDLALRSRAAFLLVAGRGVLAGYSAAELLGASCAPPGSDPPAEVQMGWGHQARSRPGLVVHRDRLLELECVRRGDVLTTSPLRTAFDLGRWAPDLVQRVVAVDALAHRRFPVEHLREFAGLHVGAHGSVALRTAFDLADPRSESPMETRLRLAIVLAGLPAPEVQFPVAGGRHRLDLAFPDLLLAVEYDGELHRTQARARRDLEREAVLVRLGWTVLRFDARTVLNEPTRIAAEVARHLGSVRVERLIPR
jgi:very-short-patch-repair endonuclease